MAQLSSQLADELRKRLNDSREDVIRHIRSHQESAEGPGAVPITAHLGQPEDMPQAFEVGDNEMAQLSQEQLLLRDINSALDRLEAGSINVCSVCGNDIPDERLLALPTAQTCVPCQEQIEARTHSAGGPTM